MPELSRGPVKLSEAITELSGHLFPTEEEVSVAWRETLDKADQLAYAEYQLEKAQRELREVQGFSTKESCG